MRVASWGYLTPCDPHLYSYLYSSLTLILTDDVWVTSWGYVTPTALGLSSVAGGVGKALKEKTVQLRSVPATECH